MKWNFKNIKSLLFLPLSFILLNSHVYGKDAVTTAEIAPSDRFNFCRLADEVEGGQFEFEWDPSNTDNLLLFDTRKNLVGEFSTGPTCPGHAMKYESIPVPPGRVGIYGELAFKDFRLVFPVVPFGTVRGSTRQYLIGTLNEGEVRRGVYLCSKSLLNELK
ncbi:MAG: hypothetical protein ACXVLQ_02500 [Bacteriovorax sp.]